MVFFLLLFVAPHASHRQGLRVLEGHAELVSKYAGVGLVVIGEGEGTQVACPLAALTQSGNLTGEF